DRVRKLAGARQWRLPSVSRYTMPGFTRDAGQAPLPRTRKLSHQRHLATRPRPSRRAMADVTAAQLQSSRPSTAVATGRPTDRLRVLIAAHSHPEMSKGGAEIAAFSLFRELQARDDCDVWFMGCDRSMEAERTGAVLMQPFSARGDIYWARGFG